MPVLIDLFREHRSARFASADQAATQPSTSPSVGQVIVETARVVQAGADATRAVMKAVDTVGKPSDVPAPAVMQPPVVAEPPAAPEPPAIEPGDDGGLVEDIVEIILGLFGL